jgi:hypothetical protein
MDYTYQGHPPPPPQLATMAQNNAALEDQQWYADSGANAHITADLENLNIQQPFNGQDTVCCWQWLEITYSQPIPNFYFPLFYTAFKWLQIYCLLTYSA